MIEQLSNAIKFLAFFTATKTGKTGLTVTVDVFNPAGTQVVTGGSATELAGGFYYYSLASGSVGTEGEYVAVFKTSDTSVDQQHIPALWVVGRAGVENLDAAISSRNSTTPPTAAAVASQVRTELTTELGRIDAAISTRSTYAGADTSGTTTLLARLTATRAGLLDNLDAAISSRSTYSGADTAGTTSLLARLTAIRAALIDNLDAAISTRLAAADYTAPPSAATNATAVRTELATELARIDVATSTRNATAPDNASITAIKAKTDNLPAAPAATGDAMTLTAGERTSIATSVWSSATRTLTSFGTLVADIWAYVTRSLTEAISVDAPTAAEIADAVWDEATAGHATAGSTGAALAAAGNAGDPWAAELPGAYAGAQAGAIVAKLNVGEAEQPVFVLPDAPLDLSLCRVYGYLETIDNRPAANVQITFELVADDAAKSERLISGRKIIVTTDSEGKIVDADANPYVELQRNDLLTPAGTQYKVTCKKLNLSGKLITLAAETFDLASLVE